MTHATQHQHIGGRAEQEDATLVRVLPSSALAVVTDGMGGLAHGREAALRASQAFHDFAWPMVEVFKPGHSLHPEHFTLALRALRAANGELSGPLRRSGTTLTGFVVLGGVCVWAHVGDTRLWHVPSGGPPRLVTNDMQLPYQPGVLMGALPLVEGNIPPESGWFPVADGDRLVLTSDGVHGGYQSAKDHYRKTPGVLEFWADYDRGDGAGLVDVGDAASVVAAGWAFSRVKEASRDNASAIVVTVESAA